MTNLANILAISLFNNNNNNNKNREVCIAGVSKTSKKSTGKVIDRKENHLVFLGNLLLPGTMTLPAAAKT